MLSTKNNIIYKTNRIMLPKFFQFIFRHCYMIIHPLDYLFTLRNMFTLGISSLNC